MVSAREHGYVPLLPVKAEALAAELEEWFYDYKEEWRRVSRESELFWIGDVIYYYADSLRQEI